MTVVKAEEINEKLIALLLSIPFAFTDILREQVSNSVLSNDVHPYYYCIFFKTSPKVRHLPPWIDIMPLSWQIPIDNAPLLFQIFISEGCIEKLEIIDMGFQSIQWERVWHSTPVLDFEYDKQYVCNYLTSGEVFIEKIRNYGRAVDLILKSKEGCIVASFRDCQIRRLLHSISLLRCSIQIDIADKDGCKYSILSCDGNIDFDCSLIFLKRNTIVD